MADLKAFFAHNVKKAATKKVAISKKFIGEDGKPIEWEFRAITPDQDEKLKQSCISKKLITQGKRKGQYETEFLAVKYQNELTVQSIVFPDLKNKELQESYGVFTESELFNLLLLPGEAIEASKVAQEVNGFDEEFDDLVEEVKN